MKTHFLIAPVGTPPGLFHHSYRYTSGTTGNPKGVTIAHSNVMALLAAVERALSLFVTPSYTTLDIDGEAAPVVPRRTASADDKLAGRCCSSGSSSDGKQQKAYDVFMAYLPLAHILELAAELVCCYKGIVLAYGNPHTLSEAGVKLKRPESEGNKGFWVYLFVM